LVKARLMRVARQAVRQAERPLAAVALAVALVAPVERADRAAAAECPAPSRS
jgi:hypothetical protein